MGEASGSSSALGAPQGASGLVSVTYCHIRGNSMIAPGLTLPITDLQVPGEFEVPQNARHGAFVHWRVRTVSLSELRGMEELNGLLIWITRTELVEF